MSQRSDNKLLPHQDLNKAIRRIKITALGAKIILLGPTGNYKRNRFINLK